MSEQAVWTAKFYHSAAPGTRYHQRRDCWVLQEQEPRDEAKKRKARWIVAWISEDAARQASHYPCGYCCQPPECCARGEHLTTIGHPRMIASAERTEQEELARELGEL